MVLRCSGVTESIGESPFAEVGLSWRMECKSKQPNGCMRESLEYTIASSAFRSSTIIVSQRQRHASCGDDDVAGMHRG